MIDVGRRGATVPASAALHLMCHPGLPPRQQCTSCRDAAATRRRATGHSAEPPPLIRLPRGTASGASCGDEWPASLEGRKRVASDIFAATCREHGLELVAAVEGGGTESDGSGSGGGGGWHLHFDRAKRRLGQTRFHLRRVSLSRHFLGAPATTRQAVTNTLLHEVRACLFARE